MIEGCGGLQFDCRVYSLMKFQLSRVWQALKCQLPPLHQDLPPEEVRDRGVFLMSYGFPTVFSDCFYCFSVLNGAVVADIDGER